MERRHRRADRALINHARQWHHISRGVRAACTSTCPTRGINTGTQLNVGRLSIAFSPSCNKSGSYTKSIVLTSKYKFSIDGAQGRFRIYI